MSDVFSAMGPEGKVALDQECENARKKILEFQTAADGVISQIESVITGLRGDYSGTGAEKFYEACNANIEQMRNMLKNVCEAYGGEEGLFKSIENQILNAEESLEKTLESTNQQFNAK